MTSRENAKVPEQENKSFIKAVLAGFAEATGQNLAHIVFYLVAGLAVACCSVTIGWKPDIEGLS